MGQPGTRDRRPVRQSTVPGAGNQDELDKIIGAWAAERQPADIIATLSDAGVISGPDQYRRRGGGRSTAAVRGMIADPWDERIGRNVKGPGWCRWLRGDSRGRIRNAGPADQVNTHHEIYPSYLGKTD